MRVRLVLLLAAAAFYTNAEVDSVATDSTPSTATSRHLRAAEKDDAHVQRFLLAMPKLSMFDHVNQRLAAAFAKLTPRTPEDKVFITIIKARKELEKYRDKDDRLADLLIQHYKADDLHAVLSRAKANKHNKELATALEQKVTEKVVNSKLKDAGPIEGLKLDKNQREMLNDLDPAHHDIVLHYLLSHYTQYDVFQILTKANKEYRDRLKQIIITDLESLGASPVQSFKFLDLHKQKALSDNMLWYVWSDYAAAYSKKYKTEEMDLASVLSDIHTEEGLFNMIKAGLKNDQGKMMAEELVKQRMNKWTEGDPLMGRALAKLGHQHDVKDPEELKRGAWLDHSTRLLNQNNYDSLDKEVKQLVWTYQSKLWNKLESAKLEPDSKDQATLMQTNLLKLWLDGKVSPNFMYKLARVRRSPPGSPLRILYKQYMTDYNNKYFRHLTHGVGT